MADDDFLCVLRVECRRPLDVLFRAHPEVRPDVAWKAGVRRGRLPALGTHGFNLTLAETGEWTRAAAALRRGLRSLAPMIAAGRKLGARFELDVGVMLGGSRFVTRSVRFGSAELTLLRELGVRVTVTSYPVGEEPRRRR